MILKFIENPIYLLCAAIVIALLIIAHLIQRLITLQIDEKIYKVTFTPSGYFFFAVLIVLLLYISNIIGSRLNNKIEIAQVDDTVTQVNPGLASTSESPMYLYDTNPENDAYIKGSLTVAQLKELDRLLLSEKLKNGTRLNHRDIFDLGITDNDVVSAYNRWHSCAQLFRNQSRVIYPNERKIYTHIK